MEGESTMRLFLIVFLFENKNEMSYGIIKDNIFKRNSVKWTLT